MVNFEIVPPIDHVSLLLSLVPAFSNSEELRGLDADDRTSVGLVFSAFARFMERLPLVDPDSLSRCVDAVECLASTCDAEVLNLLVTEVFEEFMTPDRICDHLLPKSRALFDRWLTKS